MEINDILNSHFWLIVWTPIYLFGSWLDLRYSARDYWFGFFERNPLHLWRDKYGFFAYTPNLIATVVYLAAIIVLAVFVNGGIAWALAPVGIVRGLYVLTKSIKDQRNQRVKQIEFLTNARDGIFPGGLGAGAIDNPNPVIVKADRMFYKYTPWIFVTPGADNLPALQVLITNYAQTTPESDWFKGH